MKKILLVGCIGVFSCMQLEYVEISDGATEEISSSSQEELLSSSSSQEEEPLSSSSSQEEEELSSSSSETIIEPQIGKQELTHKGISYYEAILICNAMSLEEGLDTLYQYDKPIFTEDSLFWLPNIKVLENSPGYRLPTKEEWVSAMENGEIEKLDEDVGEWLYGEVNSEYSIFELAPHFLKTVGLYKEREGYPIYGMRVVRVFLF